jgi:hypothetical protein
VLRTKVHRVTFDLLGEPVWVPLLLLLVSHEDILLSTEVSCLREEVLSSSAGDEGAGSCG